ncbi:SDR family oxidoreductase [Pseudooceanicola sp. CBS1P-1]|uniref:NAD(P)H-binding protein n=1 Tax=Pseudooceanicola albus TaxID=2692189 RepID=A0A6L7G3J8_9RHOB|nr:MULTISPECIES: SDR family oxidoreductase [Pseudooceanicola]MBT9384928.1 SDR family oxidoreductase [Pseudooceanicola endophyticus]MXN18077.1 NAD(P)H-binding protein [Pseudooceanicola albus]
MTIAVTGATGQLGRLVIEKLKAKLPADQIVALVRSPEKAADLGVTARAADYNKPETLEPALAGIDTVLLISGNEIGQRATQHANVIAAAKAAGVARIVYTSLLHADTSVLSLAEEHLATEAALAASGLKTVILRNGWYTENYLASVGPALANGAFYGAAGEGKISSASRADYADAAVAVLTTDAYDGQVLELSGDSAYTLSELAAELSRQSGKDVPYVDLSEADYAKGLEGAGLPAPMAAAYASFDTGAKTGALYDTGTTLSTLIGHPTTPLSAAMAAAL